MIAADSESAKRDIVEFLRVPEDRVEVIYIALGPLSPVRDTEQLAAFRAAHDCPNTTCSTWHAGAAQKSGAPGHRLCEAAGRAARAPPLVVAGAEGWYFQPLFERVRALGAENTITFVGYVSREEQALWYSAATAFLYPSLYEGFGLPVLEALACGTPTLTSNVSSLPEAAGDVALQVAPTDTDALADGICRLLEDEQLGPRTRYAGGSRVDGPSHVSAWRRGTPRSMSGPRGVVVVGWASGKARDGPRAGATNQPRH